MEPAEPTQSTTPEVTAISPWRAWTLLFIFSMAQLLDIFNVTAPNIALPRIADELGAPFNERQWIINAYALTFGAFLLTAGRFSAMFGHKLLFLIGLVDLGICALINGFAVNGPMLYVFRAIQGIGAAMTVPTAMSMIVFIFPARSQQDRALGIFAGMGALGNVLGTIIGGVIAEKLTWRWIFYIMAIVILVLAVASLFLVPYFPPEAKGELHLRNLDWLGLGTITLALILFVYAVTEGNNRGWGSGGVLAPLIVSIALIVAFVYTETKVSHPLIPPAIWKLPTFTPLFFITMSLYGFMNVFSFQQSQIFQQIWQTSALSAAIRFIPYGVTGFITTSLVGSIAQYVAAKYIIVLDLLCILGGTILYQYAPTAEHYWNRVFPAFIITSFGISSAFVAANLEMLQAPSRRPEIHIPGVTALIGAIFNSVLQVGSSICIAIATAITTEVNHGSQSSNPSNFQGFKTAYWFVIALAGFETLLATVALGGKPAAQRLSTQMQDAPYMQTIRMERNVVVEEQHSMQHFQHSPSGI
ncbi:MFS general substrate transporter [Panus rudis PR-1116 ss-1]|nr:MFS general substrate transporter [Panus rudis PR-1116 ss-1]